MKAFPGGSFTGWRIVAVFCWVAGGSFAWSQGARAAAPVNDNFADRIVISEAHVPIIGSTLEATEEAGERAGTTKTIWYSWVAQEGESFSFVTEHSTFMMNARLYLGDSLETLENVAVGIPNGNITLRGGQVNHIQISGVDGSSGNFRFSIRGGPDGVPIILNDPDSRAATLGTKISLGANGRGGNLEYQWFKNGAILEGATNFLMSFDAVKAEDAGEYFVRISNSFGSATSLVARLSVHPPLYVQTLHARDTNGTVQRLDVRAICVASNEVIYFAGNNGVFEMARSGEVRRISGEITSGDLMTYVAASNVVYLTDGSGGKIHKIENGAITMIVGAAGTGYLDGPLATAQFRTTTGIAVAPDGTIYVADLGNYVVRKIQDGVVSTYAGQAGVVGARDGMATEATFGNLLGMTLDASGNLFVADGSDETIRKISTNGIVSTFSRGVELPGSGFDLPGGLLQDEAANLIVTEWGGGLIRLITPDGAVLTLTGRGPSADGLGENARVRGPFGIAIDGKGNFVIADGGRLVRRGFWWDGSTPPIMTTSNAVFRGTVGSNLELKAEVSGTEPVTFQWFRNNEAVAGATNANLPLVSLSESDSGTYYLSASNTFGVTTSTNLTVSVSPSFVWGVPVRNGMEVLLTFGTVNGAVPPAGTLTNLQVQTSADLMEWKTIETVSFLTNGQHDFSLPLSEPSRFYRVVEP